MGTGFVPDRHVEPVWGVITDKGPDDDKKWEFEWEEVHIVKGEWVPVRTEIFPGGRHSRRVGYTLLNPAHEVNGNAVPIGTVVRLIPSRPALDAAGGFHRLWQFSASVLRPFKLLFDLVPTGGPELDTTITAEWLDNPGEEVTLYPEHRSGFPSGDQFLSLGIGRGPGAYFRGTYGWARYQPKGTAYTAADGTQGWRGEWQIVTLYADLIAQVVIYEDTIAPGAVGKAQLFWINKHVDEPSVISSGYQIDVFNDLTTALDVGDVLKVHFSRNHYVWMPLTSTGSTVGHGITIYASATVSLAGGDAMLSTVPMDTEIASYGDGLELQLGTNSIRNISGVDLVGVVEWSVSAQRLLGPTVGPAPAADVHSILQVVLFNDNLEITGSQGQMSSSRRRVSGEGDRAVNCIAGHVVQKLEAGKTLRVRIRKMLSTCYDDGWKTLPTECHLTFTTIPGAVLNED